MKPPVLTVDDARDPAAEHVIAEGLRRYNQEQSGRREVLVEVG
jgi:hypothetical protein